MPKRGHSCWRSIPPRAAASPWAFSTGRSCEAHALRPATPECGDTNDGHPEAHDLGRVQAVPASSKRKDQAVPMRPVHRKEQTAEEYEQRAEISQHLGER